MVKPSLQSVPEPLALDRPPTSKQVRPTCGVFEVFNVQRPFQLKIAIHLLVPWRSFIPTVIFRRFFRVTSPYGTDGQWDGQDA